MLWIKPSPSLSGAPAEAAKPRASVALAAALLFAAAAVPQSAAWLEAALVRHVLLQFPMLIGAGVLFGWLVTGRRRHGHDASAAAIPAVLLAAFCLGFWMLPRWIDRAVSDAVTDAMKIATLTLLAGVPLGFAWPRLSALAKAFIWANAVSMLGVLGWLYLSAPYRLCNNYLLNEQATLGTWLVGLAFALGLAGAGAALVGKEPSRDAASPLGGSRIALRGRNAAAPRR